MKVFNLYFKIFKKHLVIVLIYVFIFLGIAVFSALKGSSNDAFIEKRVNVYLEDFDNSGLSNGLKTALNKYVDYVDISKDDVLDALFFRQIYSVITIPKNFEEKFLLGDEVQLTQQRIENNVTSVAIDRTINKYLNYIRIYLKQTSMDINEVINKVNTILASEVKTEALIIESDQLLSSGDYFRVLSYIVTAVVLTIIGLITISFRKFEVQRRVVASPYSIKRANLEMILGNFIFVIGLVFLFCIVSLILYPDSMRSKNGILLILNLFAFAMAIFTMSYFMCLLIKKEQVLTGVNNVFSLGTSFITGAFVPQMFLNRGIILFAHLFPNYYYVYNTDLIISTQNLSRSSINKIISFLFIQLLFSLIFIVFSVILSRRQNKLES